MKLVLIDTSKKEAVVGLVDDQEVVVEKRWQADRQLGRELLEKLDEMLGEVGWKLEELDRVAVHQGPGHYSALRTGVVTATMLAESLGKGLVSVDGDNLAKQIEQVIERDLVEVVKVVYK